MAWVFKARLNTQSNALVTVVISVEKKIIWLKKQAKTEIPTHMSEQESSLRLLKL